MNEDRIRQLIQQEITNIRERERYSTANASYHIHNNIDAPKIDYGHLVSAPLITGTGTPGNLIASKGMLYVNTTALTATTRLYMQTATFGNVPVWVSFTASG